VTDVDGTPQSRADLVSKLSHEVRGPVSTLRGLVGTTLAHYDRLSDDERQEFLHLIKHEADRLERTVEQIALALKLDAGSLRVDIRRQDLGMIVREATQAADTGDHPVEIAAESIEAPVDGSLIASVVRQLIDNAVTFSPPDSTITIGLRRDGDDALIEVTDRGPGVPPDSSSAARWHAHMVAKLRSPRVRRRVRCSSSGFPWRAEWRTFCDHAPDLR